MKLNHIYCGNGKGKTTAALGLAIRAAGAGMRIHIIQFLKGAPTSELASLAEISRITVARCSQNYGFTFNMTEAQKQGITAEHNEMLRNAAELISQKAVDMLILDEFTDAYNLELLDRELADSVALRHYDSVELVITGRNPSEKYISSADYISEIKQIKHPYEKGIQARLGIEY